MTKIHKLDSKTARLKLPVRKKPYTNRLAPGIRLAYRRNAASGSWSVLGGGGRWLKRIGIADDLEPADGGNVFDYWQARERALDLARGKDIDGDKPITVSGAIKAFEADLRARGADPYNAGRVLVHLSPALLGKTVGLLNARELRRWRDGLVAKGLARSTVVRTCRMAKAAFTAAADQDKRILNRDAWRIGLAGLPDANRTREDVILPDATVQRIVTAARVEGPEFALLVELAAVTGARPIQLRRLQVGDVQADRFDPRLMMPTSAKGRRKEITRRPVPISASLALRLRQLGAGRSARAPLLLKADGNAWKRSDHLRPFVRTVVRAGLDPSVTIYSLRHSSAVRALLGGVPARVVAVNLDTSVVQLEKTYSKFIADHSDAIARQALLDLDQPAVSNVRPLR
jgi:integrase